MKWSFSKKETPPIVEAIPTNNALTAAEEAAVAMALHLFYGDVRDKESYVITIQERESPWNSKIYGLNNLVR